MVSQVGADDTRTIETWDKDKVKAELDRRGLNPRVDTEDSFHVKDLDGFDLQISGKEMKPSSQRRCFSRRRFSNGLPGRRAAPRSLRWQSARLHEQCLEGCQVLLPELRDRAVCRKGARRQHAIGHIVFELSRDPTRRERPRGIRVQQHVTIICESNG